MAALELLAHANRAHVGNAIESQDAIEVVDLVLDQLGQLTLGA